MRRRQEVKAIVSVARSTVINVAFLLSNFENGHQCWISEADILPRPSISREV